MARKRVSVSLSRQMGQFRKENGPMTRKKGWVS